MGDGETKVLRFNNEVPIEVQRTKYQATAKYDRKLVRKRLEIEEWMHDTLKVLYGCKVRAFRLFSSKWLCIQIN